MLHLAEQTGNRRKPKLHVAMAHSESEILEAQRLRYRVFADELGANLPTRTPGVDRDIYDPYCKHLIVRDENSGRNAAMRTTRALTDKLASGTLAAVFPEGTTSDGTTLLTFHGALLQAAIDAQVSVQPINLGYFDASGKRSDAAAYCGDTSLLASMLNIVKPRHSPFARTSCRPWRRKEKPVRNSLGKLAP